MPWDLKKKPELSVLIDKVWSSHGDTAFQFLSYAETRYELVIVKDTYGNLSIFFRGPETVPSTVNVPRGGERLVIQFRLGAYVPSSLPRDLVDRRDAQVPVVDHTKLPIDGRRMEVPKYEGAETFVATLFRMGIIRLDSDVVAVLHDEASTSAIRTMQMRFLRATGLSHSMLTQIQRTRDLVA